MRYLLRFTSFLIQVAKIIWFVLFKLIVEPAEQAANKKLGPVIDLKPKLTAEETLTDTISETASIHLETVSETAAILTEMGQETVEKLTQESACGFADTARVATDELNPPIDLTQPHIYDLTPQLEIPKPAITPVMMADFQPEFADINRESEVNLTLEQAWNQGITTYKDLIEYVKQQTGKGCSRRVISEWKKSRNITEFAS